MRRARSLRRQRTTKSRSGPSRSGSGPASTEGREFRHLRRRKARNAGALPAVRKTRQTLGVIAMNPFGGETVPRGLLNKSV